MSRAWIAVLATLTLAVGRLLAEAPAGEMVLHRADGGPITGLLLGLSLDWSVEVGGPSSGRVKGGDLISLRRADLPLPPPSTGPQVIFTNGDRLPGQVLDLAQERLGLRTLIAEKQELRIPLTALALVWLSDPANVDDPALLRRRLLAEQRSQDIVLLRNGDVLEGTLTGLDRPGLDGKARLHLEMNGQEVGVDRDRVAVIALNTDLARSFLPKGVYARLVLTDGSRLSLSAARLEGKMLSGQTLIGVPVRVPIIDLVSLDMRQGCAVYLSDLKPRRYEYTPYLGVKYPFVADGSVAGRELRLAGSTYDKGLGVHSQGALTYDLGKGYRRFQALVGLDDQTGRRGNVRIKVLVDGKPRDLGWDQELTLADGARMVDLDVQGARELTLVVEFGRGGDVQDHVNWADARLIR
jgi:hypothetical protein